MEEKNPIKRRVTRAFSFMFPPGCRISFGLCSALGTINIRGHHGFLLALGSALRMPTLSVLHLVFGERSELMSFSICLHTQIYDGPQLDRGC